jgi:hypothetical protein
MTQFVLTLMAVFNAHVPMAIMVIPILDFVRPHNVDVPPIRNAHRMRNVSNPESAFVHLRSLLIRVVFVVVHAKDLLVVLMQNVVQLIRHNVCAKPDLKAIRYKVA